MVKIIYDNSFYMLQINNCFGFFSYLCSILDRSNSKFLEAGPENMEFDLNFLYKGLFGLSRKGNVLCDARAETEWEKLAQNLQLKVGLQTPPPPPKVGNSTGFAKKNYHFFHSENQVKKKLATYY